MIKKTLHDKTNKMTDVTRENLDKPGNVFSWIRVFAICSKGFESMVCIPVNNFSLMLGYFPGLNQYKAAEIKYLSGLRTQHIATNEA